MKVKDDFNYEQMLDVLADILLHYLYQANKEDPAKAV